MPYFRSHRFETQSRDEDLFMVRNPEHFDASKLTRNEIDLGNVIYARIPEIKGRISRRKDGSIELITNRKYDPEAGYTRTEKVMIGHDLSPMLEGLMMINDNYHEYFDTQGNLTYDPMNHRRADDEEPEEEQPEEETEEELNEEPEEEPTPEPDNAAEEGENDPVEPNDVTPSKHAEEKTDEITREALLQKEIELRQWEERLQEKEKLVDRRLKEVEAEKELLQTVREEIDDLQMQGIIQTREAEKDQLFMFSGILSDHMSFVDNRAKKKPEEAMSPNQIRTINELLKELQAMFAGSEMEDYLKLAEEPTDNNKTGTTYGEMALILSAYHWTMATYRHGKLRKKRKPTE